MAAAVHATGDTWDVFVVGVRERSHASTVLLAAELSRYTGMPTSEVELALMKGELAVRTRQPRSDAESAAMELDDMGAVVDLRLSDNKGSELPILKPDASRRSGVAVGGFIDDSATPPAVSESSDVRPLPLELAGEALPPPPPMGAPLRSIEARASAPIRVGPAQSNHELLSAVSSLDAQGASALGHIDEFGDSDKRVVDMPHRQPDSVPPLRSRASAAPAWAVEVPQADSLGEQPPPSAPAAAPAPGYPAAVPPPPGHTPGGPSVARHPPAGYPAAGHSSGGYPVAGHSSGGYPVAGHPSVDYPQAGYPGGAGQPGTPVPPPSGHAPVPAPGQPVESAAPQSIPSPEFIPDVAASAELVDPQAASSVGMMAGLASLEVTDLPSAPPRVEEPEREPPPAAAPTGAAAAHHPGAAASDSLQLDFAAVGVTPKNKPLRELGGAISGVRQSVDPQLPRRTRAGGISGSGGAASGQALAPQPRFLLGADNITSVAVGLSVGLLMSLMLALQLQRDTFAEIFGPLEEELGRATTSQSAVNSGEVRSPPQIEAELKSEYRRLRKSFLLQWLVFGVPVGLVLSRIPRSH